MFDEKCVSREEGVSVDVPDIPEVREFWELTKDKVPEISIQTLCSYHYHLQNYVSPFYSEAVHSAIMGHVLKSGQDPACATGMIPMSELLGEVVKTLQERAINDQTFCDGFWAALMSDIVACSHGQDMLRELLAEMNAILRGESGDEDERNVVRETESTKEVG